jgi:hypothetical protein
MALVDDGSMRLYSLWRGFHSGVGHWWGGGLVCNLGKRDMGTLCTSFSILLQT